MNLSIIIKWWSSQRSEKPTVLNARLTPFTRLPNTKRVKRASKLREEDVMTENNLDTEVKPNPSSERKPKPPRRSPLDCNAKSASAEES